MFRVTSGQAHEDLLKTALAAAEAAARAHEDGVRQGGTQWTDEKTTFSDFVSDVDLAAQKAALDVITERHPDHRVMAEEEGGAVEGDRKSPYLWIVDPLDGTTNYLHGHPYYASSVAVWDEAGPVAAAVNAIRLGRVWTAVRGQGARENGTPIHVSGTHEPRRFLVGTGFPFKAIGDLEPFLGQLGRMLRSTAGVRRTGAAAIDLAYVANGTLDGFWETFLNPWDFAAGMLLVTEAGGSIERIEGGPLDASPGTVLAANGSAGLRALREITEG